MNGRRFALAVWVALGLPWPVQAAQTNSLHRAVSVSRQFVAFAPTELLPPALCVFAERVKREWLARLETTDAWRDPILIVLRPRSPEEATSPAIALQTFKTDTGLKYQIRCLAPPPLEQRALLLAVVEALCAELANRSQPLWPGRPYVAPAMPPWLVHGLAASIEGRNDLLLAVARRSLAGGRPVTATQLLAQNTVPADALQRQWFEAHAWLFTESLLARPAGGQKLRRFLAELAARKDEQKAFAAAFGEDFPEPVTLQKWWSVELARRTTATVAQNLGAEQTLRQLEEILATTVPRVSTRASRVVETPVPLETLWRYSEQPWLKDLLLVKLNRLSLLRSQAHPRYREVIEQYMEAFRWLAAQKLSRHRRALRAAEQARAAADAQTRAIASYMDQAERVYAPGELAGVFSGYFETLEQFQKLEQQRRNPISDYLDRFER